MMILVTGGSKCGKSGFAEQLLADVSGEKYYIATMQPFGAEAHAAIARHRKMRKSKNFITIEQYTDIDRIVLPPHSVALLECMGNLCANEMFRENKIISPVNKILKGLEHLCASTEKFVIVTNQVGDDGITYEAGTMQYISAMSEINQEAAVMADIVIECVCGIPLVIKGDFSC